MSAPVLFLTDIALSFGGTPLLERANLSVAEGDRICIVGRNGSGKSTLMKIAVGLIEPDAGTRFLKPGVTLRYLPQEPDFGTYPTVRAYVEGGLAPGDDAHAAAILLSEFGLTGEEDPKTLSGGEARRAALARVLAPEPDILLLDEPTNHLDIAMIERLEEELKALRGALVLISHDRRFLSALSKKTVWVDRGVTRQVDFGFAAFETWRDEQLAQEEIEQHKVSRKIEREAHWLRYGVTARRKRNVRRLEALKALREEKRTMRRAPASVKMEAAQADISGKLVIEAVGVTKAFAGMPPIVADFNLKVNRADRVGIVGPNGAGKTTLVNLLTGKLIPDSGSVRLGANLEVASLEQNRNSLKPEWTVADALTGGGGDTVVVNGQARHVASYMQDFLFAPEQMRTPLKVLSGGERARLMLARAFTKPSNLLVLDEPTNDLDLETLDVLEDLLADYKGTVIIISHDRDFLDRVVTSVIAPEGRGRWVEYAGGYSDMLAQRAAPLGGKKAASAAKSEPKPQERAKGERPAEPKAKRKLSFNEKHALETLPKRIAELERTIGELERRLSDPLLFEKDRAAFEAATAALAEAQAELGAAETRWLELELLREELGL